MAEEPGDGLVPKKYIFGRSYLVCLLDFDEGLLPHVLPPGVVEELLDDLLFLSKVLLEEFIFLDDFPKSLEVELLLEFRGRGLFLLRVMLVCFLGNFLKQDLLL